MKKNYFKNITYVDKISTPLLWHNFNRFFRIPLSILIYFYCTIKAFGSSLWLIGIFGTVSLIAMFFFEFNNFKWKAEAHIGINTFIVNNFYLGIMICFYCSLPVLTLVAVFVLCVLEYLYYYKRRELFNNITINEGFLFDFQEMNDGNFMLTENRRKAVIALSKRLDEMNVPSLKEMQEKIDSLGGINHCDFYVYLTRYELEQLSDSLGNDISFYEKYKYIEEMIDRMFEDCSIEKPVYEKHQSITDWLEENLNKETGNK